jgi:hypothetical protein
LKNVAQRTLLTGAFFRDKICSATPKDPTSTDGSNSGRGRAGCLKPLTALEGKKTKTMGDSGSIPFFPPFCVAKVDESDACELFGVTIPCHRAFNEDTLGQFGYGLESSHIWTFVLTFAIGLISLWNLKWPWDFHHQSLKATCALYAIETSFFSLIRFFWGVCKPLVAFAALHNLFEWSIVLHVAHGTTDLKILGRRLSCAALFIGILIILCLCIPDLETALGVEMVFGIMLDFGIPIMFLSQLSNPTRGPIYAYAAAAHTGSYTEQMFRWHTTQRFAKSKSNTPLCTIVHLLGTILPLVFAIYFSGSTSWFSDFVLEILINVSVPVTHFLYCIWSYHIAYVSDEAGIFMTDQPVMVEDETSPTGTRKRRTSFLMEELVSATRAIRGEEDESAADHLDFRCPVLCRRILIVVSCFLFLG